VVPEADHPEAVLVQIGGSGTIRFLVMLSSVGFDDELAFQADEVGHERSDRVLVTEFPAQTARPQPRPQQALGIRRMAAQAGRMWADLAFDRRHGEQTTGIANLSKIRLPRLLLSREKRERIDPVQGLVRQLRTGRSTQAKTGLPATRCGTTRVSFFGSNTARVARPMTVVS
jgi:hypothetical protein